MTKDVWKVDIQQVMMEAIELIQNGHEVDANTLSVDGLRLMVRVAGKLRDEIDEHKVYQLDFLLQNNIQSAITLTRWYVDRMISFEELLDKSARSDSGDNYIH